MKKIAILTLYGYQNYGNRFQNYAVQQIFRKFGYEVETIVAYQTQKTAIKNAVLYFSSYLNYTDGKRLKCIANFSKKYISTHYLIPCEGKIPHSLSNKYDYFVVGSDQVWNPLLRTPNELYNYFLTFAKKEQRISICPSFGTEQIPDHLRNTFIKGLNGFQTISVREDAGKNIVSELTGKEATVLIDPTLMLAQSDWEKIIPNTIKLQTSKKYILSAFLGSLSEQDQLFINDLAQQKGYDIISVFHSRNCYSPNEILLLIKNAELICSDSFHFSAFSINFNRPFIVFKRHENLEAANNMFSRIETLLKKFGLQNRVYHKIRTQDIFQCDFTNSNEILVNERNNFWNYLNQVLK